MSVIIQSGVNADAGVGTDLLKDSLHRVAGNDRDIVSVGLAVGAVGSTLMKADLYIGDINVGVIPVVTQGAAAANAPAPKGQDMYPMDAFVPAGTEVRAIVATGPGGTTAWVLAIEIEDDDDDDDWDDDDDDEMAPEFV